MRLNGDGAERPSWAAGRGRFRAHLRHGPPHAPVPLSSFPADSKPSHPCPCLGRSLHPQGGKCTQHLKMLKEVPPGRSLRDRWRTVRGSRNLPRWAAQRHSSCPYPQTVSFGSSEKHVGVWGPLGHQRLRGRFVAVYVHSACLLRSWCPTESQAVAVVTVGMAPGFLAGWSTLAWPRPGAGGRVAGFGP